MKKQLKPHQLRNWAKFRLAGVRSTLQELSLLHLPKEVIQFEEKQELYRAYKIIDQIMRSWNQKEE